MSTPLIPHGKCFISRPTRFTHQRKCGIVALIGDEYGDSSRVGDGDGDGDGALARMTMVEGTRALGEGCVDENDEEIVQCQMMDPII